MNKKLVGGFGINDIPGSSNEKYYKFWCNMIKRCYNKIYLSNHPSYKDTTIDNNWKYLSNFRDWYVDNYIDNYVLDKDIYIPDNKIYSSNTCLFVPSYINQLIINKKGKGYSKQKSGRYQAKISINNKDVNIGTYDTKEEAHKNYAIAKSEYIINIADEYISINNKLWIGLYRHAEIFIGNDWKKTLPKFENKS